MVKQIKKIFILSLIILSCCFGGVSMIQAADDAYTDDQHLFKKAVAEQDISYCNQLVEMSRDQCIYIVVTSSNNQSFCQEIQDQNLKSECLGFTEYQRALKENDINICLSLNPEDLRRKCLTFFFDQQTDIDYCQNFSGFDQLLCQDLVYKNLAIANQDLRQCDNISDRAVLLDCQTIIKSLPQDSDKDGIIDMLERSYGFDPFAADTDGDGLDDLIEASEYQTDPRLADTDNDGVSDGQEIALGSDPKDEKVTAAVPAEDVTEQPMKLTNIFLIVVGVLIISLVVLFAILKYKK